MKLSVVIINYNVKFFLEQCLYAVRAATSGLEAEIIVIDNYSSDQSLEYLQPKFPEVKFVANTINVGFAKANNQAIQMCTGEYILILNPDTVIGEETLRTLCFFMDEHSDCGAIGVKMLDGHGVFLPESKRAFPTPWVSFCKIFGLSRLFPDSKCFAKYSLPYLNNTKQHEVEVLAGAFMLVRKEAFEKAGLFDESFFMYGEDIDLSYRIVKAGYKSFYIPERILHYKGESTKKDDLKYIRSFYGAMLIFYNKYYPGASIPMRFVIKGAISFKGFSSFLTGMLGLKRKPEPKHKRLLILCKEEHFAAIKTACLKKMPDLEYVNLWDLNEEHVMDAICRRNQMKLFTDIAFYYPDVRFEQMLLFMDRMPNKKTNYHIYNKYSSILI